MSAALLTSVGAASPLVAQSVDGRYLGSFTHVDASGQSSNNMRHVYDAVIREALPRDLQLDLGTSLRYELEPGRRDTDILRARFFGDVRGTAWRVHGQYVPWQRMRPETVVPRRRDAQAGFEWTSRLGAQMRLNLNRSDRETDLGLSRLDDRRIELLYTRAGFGTNVGYRRLEGEPGGRGLRNTTDEYRAGLRGSRNWRSVSVSGAYDAVIADRTTFARRTDQDMQRANLSANWQPNRKVTVSSHLQRRWGKTSDSGLFLDRLTRELSTGARLLYLPFAGLSLDVLREYRQNQVAAGNLISDYVRFETLYRRPVARATMFQTGYAQSIDLRRRGGGVPTSSVFGAVDGVLRRGIRGRAELRAARSATVSTGTQWRRLVQLNTRPTRLTRFDVLWQRDTLPEIAGAQQRDRTWELLGGYQPTPETNIVVSYRRLDGTGRIMRADDFWAFNAAWRMAERTSLGFNGSSRRTRLQQSQARVRVASVDLTFWPAEQSKVRASWRRTKTAGRRRDASWNVIVSQTF